jgi:hypothetical protein
MKRCYECDKELKFWNSYHHPTLGYNTLVCSKCFDIVAESMKKYRRFILSEMKQEELKSIVNITDIKLKFYKFLNKLKKHEL